MGECKTGKKKNGGRRKKQTNISNASLKGQTDAHLFRTFKREEMKKSFGFVWACKCDTTGLRRRTGGVFKKK